MKRCAQCFDDSDGMIFISTVKKHHRVAFFGRPNGFCHTCGKMFYNATQPPHDGHFATVMFGAWIDDKFGYIVHAAPTTL